MSGRWFGGQPENFRPHAVMPVSDAIPTSNHLSMFFVNLATELAGVFKSESRWVAITFVFAGSKTPRFKKEKE